jgi:hypothetical protein
MTSAAPSPASRTAACDCGALRLVVTGDPVHVHGCACSQCQRASGSVMKLSAWFPEAGVTILGRFATWDARGPDHPGWTTHFCPVCGGLRFFRTGPYLPDCIGIPVGAFADPAFPAPDHIHWWPDRPHWLTAPAGLVLLEGN